MTERQWLAGRNSENLADYWGERFTERKAHLLMLAFCRRQAHHFGAPVLHEALAAVAAHFADPAAPDKPFEGRRLRALYARVEGHATALTDDTAARGVAFGVLAAVEPRSVGRELAESLRYLVYSCLADISNNLPNVGRKNGRKLERAAQAGLVRDVLGNPFRPAAVKPEWRTDTVLALARQMYASEDFGAMPILADALQDAGCDSAGVLDHCRGRPDGALEPAAGHVRGCWVLDSIFGKV